MQILFNTAFIAHFIATQIVHNIGHGFEGRLAHPIAQNTIFYFPHSPSFSSKTTSFHSCLFFVYFPSKTTNTTTFHVSRLMGLIQLYLSTTATLGTDESGH